MAEVFYVGLARGVSEIAGRDYSRQRMVLTFREPKGLYANETSISFAPASWDYGFVDGVVLAASMEGPVLAVTALIVPLRIGVGMSFAAEPGYIVMNRRSLDAIKSAAPIEVRVPASV